MLDVRIRAKTICTDAGVPRPILRNVSFSAHKGEIVALLGPSGIGKSTIIRIVTGLDREFEGSVHRPAGRLGMMFQEPRLLPWLAVDDNIRLVQPEGIAAADVPALLEEVLLSPTIRAMLPAALSLGMARRVALARAFAVEPDILVLDEPFASLDPSLAGALGARIAHRARARGTLVLLSTHNPDHALAMASRVLVLSGQPATLAADLPAPADPAAVRRLRDELVGRFAFLTDSSREENAVQPS